MQLGNKISEKARYLIFKKELKRVRISRTSYWYICM